MKTLLSLLFGSLLLAQAFYAMAYEGESFSISGTVTDGNWNTMPGALVTLYDGEFNVITSQDTNQNGSFYFQNMILKTSTCTVRVSYIENGTVHSLPGYYTKFHPASGEQSFAPDETHFDDYYLPGSVPRVTPTPTPLPTMTPSDTPIPDAASENSQTTQALIFAGGYIGGMITATLACLIIFRRPGKK
jgi:hypothetical protein